MPDVCLLAFSGYFAQCFFFFFSTLADGAIQVNIKLEKRKNAMGVFFLNKYNTTNAKLADNPCTWRTTSVKVLYMASYFCSSTLVSTSNGSSSNGSSNRMITQEAGW